MSTNPVKINLEWCKSCGICISVCPKKVFEWSGEISGRGVRVPEIAHPENCIQCMQCEMMCPDLAIAVRKKKDGKPGKAAAGKRAKKKPGSAGRPKGKKAAGKQKKRAITKAKPKKKKRKR